MLLHRSKSRDLKQDDNLPSESLDDARLRHLAREWRDRARHGDQIAPGIADAFEAEIRRRERRIDDASGTGQPRTSGVASRPWWKFW